MLSLLAALSVLAGPGKPSGTYVVTFCTSECTEQDTALVLAQGVVVLDTARAAGAAEDYTACLKIERKRRIYGYLAGVSPAQTKWWDIPGDSVGFLTYVTPEASHTVLAELTPAGFRGTGSSDGEGISEIDVADEYVIGRRTGPPDPRQCGLPAAASRKR